MILKLYIPIDRKTTLMVSCQLLDNHFKWRLC